MNSKSSLFLIELIIAVLFFALASTVCIQMFALGHTINVSNSEKEHAIMLAQSLAESYEAADGDVNAMAGLFDEAIIAGDDIYMYFDDEWNSASEEAAVYEVSLTSAEDGRFSNAEIAATNLTDDEEIYTLDTRVYHSMRRGQ